jgi:ubiquinone/menaquinone biosynthesis C-methylase UbiE
MRKRQTFFNQAAKNWDKEYNSSKLQTFLKQFVQSFGILAGEHVLDVGTGTGILIPFLLEIVGSKGHITAIDYAKSMIDVCKSKYSHLPNVSIQIANVENLPFPDVSFDAVTCFGLFPHLDNKKVTLQQFHRVLKLKGKLIIAHALSSTEIIRHHRNTPTVAKDVLPNEVEMRKLLQQASFTEIQIVDKQGSYLCTSIKPFGSGIKF